jgi:GH24 family phage-related lysozyme (muramidase)
MIGNFGNATYKSILQVEPEDAEDQGLVTSLRTLKELRDTDTDLFLKQFPDNGVQMMSLFKKMDEQGMTPWAAVTNAAQTRDRLEARGGKPYVPTDADNEQKTKRLDKVKGEFIDELTNQGLFNFGDAGVETDVTWTSWAQNSDPANMSQLNEEFSRIFDEEFAIHGDSSEAADAARYRIQANGVQVGPAFVINGVKAEEASGFSIEAYVKGWSDDDDINELMTGKYGLPEGTNFLDQMRSATVSADGTTITGMLASDERGMVPFQFKMPTSKSQMLQTNEEKRTEVALDVLRTGRDVAYEAAHLATTGSSPTDLNTPLKDTATGIQSLTTKVITGRDVNADIGAETIHQNKKRELEALDLKAEQKSNTYHGAQAITQVELQEGRPLTYIEKVIVNDEGYVDGNYFDTKGIQTSGVGQTGVYQDMSFTETVAAHVKRAEGKLPEYKSYPEWLQAELVSAEYRGDLGQSPKAMAFARAGQWDKAAAEFLNNAEYKHAKTPKSIKARMRRTAAAMSRYGQQL